MNEIVVENVEEFLNSQAKSPREIREARRQWQELADKVMRKEEKRDAFDRGMITGRILALGWVLYGIEEDVKKWRRYDRND